MCCGQCPAVCGSCFQRPPVGMPMPKLSMGNAKPPYCPRAPLSLKRERVGWRELGGRITLRSRCGAAWGARAGPSGIRRCSRAAHPRRGARSPRRFSGASTRAVHYRSWSTSIATAPCVAGGKTGERKLKREQRFAGLVTLWCGRTPALSPICCLCAPLPGAPSGLIGVLREEKVAQVMDWAVTLLLFRRQYAT